MEADWIALTICGSIDDPLCDEVTDLFDTREVSK